MGTAERRRSLFRTLCRRRHDTIANLAQEYGVSERTIRRDIEAISLSEPIYTMAGRYTGGVYVVDGYRMERSYFNDSQSAVLQKVLEQAKSGEACQLSEGDIYVLTILLAEYTKPHC